MFDLKLFRTINKLTQDDLSKYLGVTQGFVSQIEKGVRPFPEDLISKILADGQYALPPEPSLSDCHIENDNLVGIISSQQETINRLTRIIENLTNK